MAGLADSAVADALAGLASAREPAAAGVAAALACATAAALVELTAGLASDRLAAEGGGVGAAEAERLRGLGVRAGELRTRLPSLADRDAAVYGEVGRADSAEDRAAALDRATEPPLEIAEAAAEVAEAAAAVAAAGSWPFTPDALVGGELALAAARSAARLVSANVSAGAGSLDSRAARAAAAAARAEAASGRGE